MKIKFHLHRLLAVQFSILH